jgi:hypothetical protein
MKNIKLKWLNDVKRMLTDRKFVNYLNKGKYSDDVQWFEYGYIDALRDVIKYGEEQERVINIKINKGSKK